jgi:hypothetical protein
MYSMALTTGTPRSTPAVAPSPGMRATHSDCHVCFLAVSNTWATISVGAYCNISQSAWTTAALRPIGSVITSCNE